jgi:beta-glucosidase
MINRAATIFAVSPEDFSTFFLAGNPKGTEVLLAAHQKGAAAIHAKRSTIPVGLTLALQDMQAVEGGGAFRDQLRCEIQDIWLEASREDDFLGVQTYSRERIGPEGLLEPEGGVEVTQMGYEFWPQALEATLRYANKISGVPMMVTENGIGTDDDTRRIAYYQGALQGVARALADGLDIRGYFAWSAFDNFEWMMGYGPKFGLIEVDRETQKRKPKPSASYLGAIAKANKLLEARSS